MAFTLQWTVVSVFLFIEIGIVSLLLLPWIPARWWQRLYRSRLSTRLSRFARIYVPAIAGVLFLLFVDAARDCRRFSGDSERSTSRLAQGGDVQLHMRLFRAQRNLYISGFALFLWLVINRLMQLIVRQAQLQASSETVARVPPTDDDNEERVQQLQKQLADVKRQLSMAQKERESAEESAKNVRVKYELLVKEMREKEEGEQSGAGSQSE